MIRLLAVALADCLGVEVLAGAAEPANFGGLLFTRWVREYRCDRARASGTRWLPRQRIDRVFEESFSGLIVSPPRSVRASAWAVRSSSPVR